MLAQQLLKDSGIDMEHLGVITQALTALRPVDTLDSARSTNEDVAMDGSEDATLPGDPMIPGQFIGPVLPALVAVPPPVPTHPVMVATPPPVPTHPAMPVAPATPVRPAALDPTQRDSPESTLEDG